MDYKKIKINNLYNYKGLNLLKNKLFRIHFYIIKIIYFYNTILYKYI